MRLLQLVHQYLPDHVGGTELYTQALGRALVRRGHEVAIFHRRDASGRGLVRATSEAGEVYAAWHGRFTPLRRFGAAFDDRHLLAAFEKTLQATDPEIVHVEHAMGQPLALFDRLRSAGIPYVVTLWDFWWVCANAQLLTNYSGELCGGPRAYLNCARCALARVGWPDLPPLRPPLAIPHALRNRRLRHVLAHADRLIAPAKFVARWYAAHGIPDRHLVVIPPGLEPPPAPGAAAASKEPGTFSVGYIGGLAPQKGVHLLLEAFATLPAPARLHVAGDPSADPAYYTRLQSLAGPEVTFHGRLDRPGIWAFLTQVDVVAVPSLWYETFVFVISEAFAAGVPVIASDLGVVGDRVRHGIDGLLFPAGDATALTERLARLQRDPALLRRLRAGIVPPPTMDDHVAEVEAQYRAVVEARMRW